MNEKGMWSQTQQISYCLQIGLNFYLETIIASEAL